MKTKSDHFERERKLGKISMDSYEQNVANIGVTFRYSRKSRMCVCVGLASVKLFFAYFKHRMFSIKILYCAS